MVSDKVKARVWFSRLGKSKRRKVLVWINKNRLSTPQDKTTLERAYFHFGGHRQLDIFDQMGQKKGKR